MITGFNSDVSYKGLRFHVQTEDKGPKNPVIETLLYHKGMILASRKTPYEHIINDEELETKIKKLMVKQHQEMIMDLKLGAFDELILGTKKEEVKEDESFEEMFLKSISKFKRIHLDVERFEFVDIYLKIDATVKSTEMKPLENASVEVFLKLPDGKRMFLVKELTDKEGRAKISLPAPQIEKPYIIIVFVEVKGLGMDERWFRVD